MMESYPFELDNFEVSKYYFPNRDIIIRYAPVLKYGDPSEVISGTWVGGSIAKDLTFLIEPTIVSQNHSKVASK